MCLSFALIILSAAALKNNILSHVFLYLALLFFGTAYYQNHNILPDRHIANFAPKDGSEVSLKGIVVDDPSVRKAFYGKNKISFTVEAEQLKRGSLEQRVTGLVKTDVYASGNTEAPEIGDEVILTGALSRPQGLKNPGCFDYSRYLMIKNIYAAISINEDSSMRIMKRGPANPVVGWAYFIRRGIRDAIMAHVKEPCGGFIKAILIGERSELDNSVTDDFIKTGTVHVIAISGLNIALVAGIFLFLFRIFGLRKRWNLAATSFVIVLYCFVAGATPPVVRATAVFVISCAGYLMNREADILNSLSIAAFLILLTNPMELFDPSFQLSFGSVISIILFAPRIEKVFPSRLAYLTKSVSVSVAACAGVFPIVAKYFNIVSPMAIAANLIIVPAMLVITIASFIYLLLYFAGASFCAAWAGWALSLLTQAVFYINHILAKVPFSYVRIPAPSPFFLAAYYTFLFAFFFIPRKRNLLIPFLLFISIFVWAHDLDPAKESLRAAFLDVGNGDSAVIRFPRRGVMLIDGGSGGVEGMTDMGKSVVAPYLWNKAIKKIDAVVVTHFHEDHLGGLFYILDNFRIGCVMDSGHAPSGKEQLYDRYLAMVRKKKIRRIVIGEGDEINGFGRARIFILNPVKDEEAGNPNDDSVVIKLEYEDFSLLSCGDISSGVMERLIRRGEFLESDIIKIPHHGGSIGEMDKAKIFFEAVSPRACVISAGGRYGLRAVSKKTRGLLESLNSHIYETKTDGAIEAVSGGKGFEIKPLCAKN